jgi:hypothetical protein
MASTDDIWICLLLVALFGLLFFLRIRFPKASRGPELAVLVSATVIFFSLCSFLKTHNTAATRGAPIAQFDHPVLP